MKVREFISICGTMSSLLFIDKNNQHFQIISADNDFGALVGNLNDILLNANIYYLQADNKDKMTIYIDGFFLRNGK